MLSATGPRCRADTRRFWAGLTVGVTQRKGTGILFPMLLLQAELRALRSVPGALDTPQSFTRVLFPSGDTVGLPRPPPPERVVTTTGGAVRRWYSAVDPEG